MAHARNFSESVTSWTTANSAFTSYPENFKNGTYDENSEYSLYRWTYFFDYEESDYNPGPEIAAEKDSRFKDEETRLANAILWLRAVFEIYRPGSLILGFPNGFILG